MAAPVLTRTRADRVGRHTTANGLLTVADTDNRGTLHFLTALLRADGKALGAYDGRVLGIDTGIAGSIRCRVATTQP